MTVALAGHRYPLAGELEPGLLNEAVDSRTTYMGYIARLSFVVLRISSRQHLHHSVICSTIRLFPIPGLLPTPPHPLSDLLPLQFDLHAYSPPTIYAYIRQTHSRKQGNVVSNRSVDFPSVSYILVKTDFSLSQGINLSSPVNPPISYFNRQIFLISGVSFILFLISDFSSIPDILSTSTFRSHSNHKNQSNGTRRLQLNLHKPTNLVLSFQHKFPSPHRTRSHLIHTQMKGNDQTSNNDASMGRGGYN